mgnify:CR=1 FL=1
MAWPGRGGRDGSGGEDAEAVIVDGAGGGLAATMWCLMAGGSVAWRTSRWRVACSSRRYLLREDDGWWGSGSRVPGARRPPCAHGHHQPQSWTLVVAIADGVGGDMAVGEGHGLAGQGLTWRVCSLATPLSGS